MVRIHRCRIGRRELNARRLSALAAQSQGDPVDGPARKNRAGPLTRV